MAVRKSQGTQAPETSPTAPPPPESRQLAVIEGPKLSPLLKGMRVNNPLAAAFLDGDDKKDFTTEKDLAILRIDHARACFTLGGNKYDETFEGYLLHYFQQRAWWLKKYQPGTNVEPDCRSPDCVTPDPESPKRQAPTCSECPNSEFGSGENGTSQACKVSTFFMIVNPARFPPHGLAALIVPPTSIQSMIGTPKNAGYLGKAKQFRAPGGDPCEMYQIVYGRFSLERIEGTVACRVVGEPIAMIPSVEEAKALQTVRNRLIEIFNSLRGRILRGDPEDPSTDKPTE